MVTSIIICLYFTTFPARCQHLFLTKFFSLFCICCIDMKKNTCHPPLSHRDLVRFWNNSHPFLFIWLTIEEPTKKKSCHKCRLPTPAVYCASFFCGSRAAGTPFHCFSCIYRGKGFHFFHLSTKIWNFYALCTKNPSKYCEECCVDRRRKK